MSRSSKSHRGARAGGATRRTAIVLAGAGAIAAAALAAPGAAGRPAASSAPRASTHVESAIRSAGPLSRLAHLGLGSPTTIHTASGHADLRPVPLRESSLNESSNWSGYGGLTTAGSGVAAQWIVPATATSGSEKYSATWVGVDGIVSDPLLQAGTEQDGRTEPGAGSRYFAWMESLPAPPTELVNPKTHRPYVVRPGDHFGVAIYPSSSTLLGSGTKQWTVDIADETQKWSVAITKTDYQGTGGSAEWIEEAPTLVSSADPKGTITTMANFRTVRFLATALYTGGKWYGTALTGRDGIELIQRSSGRTVTIARPAGPVASAGSSTTQAFEDYYVTAPTAARATPGAGSAKVAWNTPVANGEAPVIGYLIRVYRAGVLDGTVTVYGNTTTHLVTGLTPGVAYSFSVSARRSGGFASLFSARSRTVTPVG